MNYDVKEVAIRLKGIRESLDISVEDICEKAIITKEDYIAIEAGEKDCSLSFVYKCAEIFGVDLVEILTGENPKLSKYSVVRCNNGLPIERRKGFGYQHLAYLFKGKGIEPLLVDAPLEDDAENKPIVLSVHEGQEFDYVIKGSLKCVFGDKIEILHEGDAVYYDSMTPHGMVAIGESDCSFMAILVKK